MANHTRPRFRRSLLLGSLLFLTGLWACQEVTGPIWVAGLRIQPDSLFLLPGEVGQLTAVPFDQRDQPLPERAGRVEWTTTNSTVTTIEQPGDGSASVTALKAGTSNVRARLGRGSKLGLIYVEPQAIATVAISPSPIEIGQGTQFGSGATVRAILKDADGNDIPTSGYRISWRVSNRDVIRLGTGQEVLTGPSTSVRGIRTGTSTITLQVGQRQAVTTITVR